MRHGIEFGLGEMLYTYFLREHDREKGRYNFYVRPDRVQLVNHLKTNDRGWKQSYFFHSGRVIVWTVWSGGYSFLLEGFWSVSIFLF